MKQKKLFGSIALVVVGVIFSSVLVSGFGWVRPSYEGDVKIGAKTPPVSFDASANAFSKAFTEVAEKVTPTIVNVNVVADAPESKEEEFFFFPFQNREGQPKQVEGSGSGIIISEDGYILTNNHVVEKATKVTVGLNDKRNFDATVVGRDPLTDLAVLKIDAKNLPVAYLGESDNLKVGQWVMAIGNPYGLTSTVTAGIISAMGRGLGLINGQNTENGGYGVEDFIQTDAAINPGNSGGALVDLSGAVIGVNAAIASRTGSYVGYGFAIPISLAKSVAMDLIAHGKVNRGYIGVQIKEVDETLAKSLGMDKAKGVIVESLVSGGSAEKADIKQGDVILKIDSKAINEANELQGYIATKSAGAVVKLLLFRDGKEIERSVTLKSKDNDSKTEKVSDTGDKKVEKEKLTSFTFDKLGMSVKNLTNKEKDDFKVEKGVLISEVKQFSKAYDKNLGKGLVIVEADRKNIKNVDQFKSIIDAKKGNAVLLRVQDSKGNSSFVGLDIPE